MVNVMFFRNRQRNKEKIHYYANELIQQFAAIIKASAKNVYYGMTKEENYSLSDLEASRLVHDFQNALLGILCYIVAGLGYPEVATEMIEIYRGIYLRYPSDIMLEKKPIREIEDTINRCYQKSREIADQYMNQGKTLGEINHAFAVSLFIWIGSKSNDNDIYYVERALNIFYVRAKEILSDFHA